MGSDFAVKLDADSDFANRLDGIGERDLTLMATIDEIHLELPFYGARRIRDELRDRGFAVGRDHTSTLMGRMGLEALFPKKKLSKPAPGHKIYPYLLRCKDITRAGEVWCADVERHEALFYRVEVKGLDLRAVAAARVKLRAA